jgi:hypothetical protein
VALELQGKEIWEFLPIEPADVTHFGKNFIPDANANRKLCIAFNIDAISPLPAQSLEIG